MQYVADATNDLRTSLARTDPADGLEPSGGISVASCVQRMVESIGKLSFIMHMLPQEARRLLLKSDFYQDRGETAKSPSSSVTIMDVPISKFCDGQNRKVNINYECGFSLW